ncbi:hypothetical protein OVA07_05430 [Novosphingobium sp. SL115]|jgi:hypothetical protein|uniref:hypothetical protein n=1 Tax=Novosphingobium sp. SL115 TaxID=2995150 RepID=UPI0022750A00|nr:hypothetical protein [Novosphingobium sp. SL115]MCY1670452.1 hypothetical protein [Novosphingobium sp. SL115]
MSKLSERPAAIVWFERTLLASQLVRIVNVSVNATAMAALLGVDKRSILIGPYANAMIALGLGLVVSRARVGFARWFVAVLVGFELLGLAGIPEVARMLGAPFAAFSTLAIILMLAAGVLMFRPQASAWLNQNKAD